MNLTNAIPIPQPIKSRSNQTAHLLSAQPHWPNHSHYLKSYQFGNAPTWTRFLLPFLDEANPNQD